MEQNGNNRVSLSGKIDGPLSYSHSLFGEAFYSGTLAVARLSGVVDLLPITASERLLRECDLQQDSFVTLKGQLRSYNKMVEGTNRLILTVFVQNLEKGDGTPYNEITISGYVCKPPIYRTTPFHREIADILLAVNRAYNKSDYIPCITWGRSARFAKTLEVGSRVEASGRVQSREYQKTLDNGMVVNRTAFEVSVSALQIDASSEML